MSLFPKKEKEKRSSSSQTAEEPTPHQALPQNNILYQKKKKPQIVFTDEEVAKLSLLLVDDLQTDLQKEKEINKLELTLIEACLEKRSSGKDSEFFSKVKKLSKEHCDSICSNLTLFIEELSIKRHEKDWYQLGIKTQEDVLFCTQIILEKLKKGNKPLLSSNYEKYENHLPTKKVDMRTVKFKSIYEKEKAFQKKSKEALALYKKQKERQQMMKELMQLKKENAALKRNAK